MKLLPEDVALCVADPIPSTDGPAPTSPPIVLTSLFSFPDFESLIDGLGSEHSTTVYSRGRNPTVMAVEEKLARLERGEDCVCFASGMGAISAVFHAFLSGGDHVLFANRTYGPTRQLGDFLGRFGIECSSLLAPSVDDVVAGLQPNTRLIWLENPASLTFELIDVQAIAAIARERGILTALDNSWATPLLQKPLELGVDIVVHTATKYLGGHSDLVAGAVIADSDRIERVFHDGLLLGGAPLDPVSAWLLLRGLRTLPARLRQHEKDGLEVATRLAEDLRVATVHHPGLADGAQSLAGQLNGFAGTFSFELATEDFETVRTFVDALEHFRIGVSWGGVESLVLSTARPDRPSGLVRLSIGLEGADLLLRDLDRALEAALGPAESSR